ncbi:MAG: hypothetical protein JWO07_254, partial [Candidatus Saccharibacteria bacterium]|nr:hypothetical protein [Candidatus Saccharibacteria bacterium]
LGADLIGFHTPGYVQNFLKTCEKADLGIAGDQTLTLIDRSIRVADFPMGIDYEKYASSGRSKVVKQAMKKYRRMYRGKKIIVAVDRMDPSKGLLERLKTYGELLKQHPKLRKKVVFSMVAAPSRTDVPAYQRLAKRLDILVAEINKTYGTAKWQPVDYINRTVPFEEVTALFRVADVAFIAPLRDGMNLAAKEFVASAHRNSVLILSETAGAAQELQDALIVNPRKPETVVKALYDALTMRRWELRRRLRRMKRYLKVHTVQNWATEFVNVLNKPIPRVASLTLPLGVLTQAQIVSDFSKSNKRLLLLDYDGTLVPFSADYHKAGPPKEVTNLLKKLGNDPRNEVVVISGRSGDDLDEWFGKLPIHLVAEHGASTKLVGGKWRMKGSKDEVWKQLLVPVLEKYAHLTPHAKVEVKAHSLVWHYRSSPPYYAQKYSVIIRQALRPILKGYGLEVIKGNKVLEIKNPDITKGKAVESMLRHKHDFIIAIGDDATDEDLFKAIPDDGYSVKVGRGITAAKYRVSNHQAVLRLLEKLAK